MPFHEAWLLVQRLEGGKADLPGDRGGPTNIGMTQQTWQDLGFGGSVLEASVGQIAAAYKLLWDWLRIHNPETHLPQSVFELMPGPADAAAFQFYINVPTGAFIKALQGALGVQMDGVLGPLSWTALSLQAGRGEQLAERLLTVQEWYYHSLQSPFKKGWLNRVAAVRSWLTLRVEEA